MMLIIDYLNVLTKGLWSKSLQQDKWKQVLLGTLLGLIPGCLGTYVAVSLYIHNIFGLGAMVASMIATSGDEAFFMLSIIPSTAILIFVLLAAAAVITGFAVNFFSKERPHASPIKHFDIHKDEPDCICFDRHQLLSQIRNMSLLRMMILLALAVSLVLVSLNFDNLLEGIISHGEEESHSHHFHPVWVGVTFSFVLGISFLISATVNEHFLKEHLVNHILRKHALRIFLWVAATLILMHFITERLDVEGFISDNIWIVLFIAVLVGIIPESGPHLVFIILFASGTLPLSILIANSIVQDGHGSLPLLAESPKAFIQVKIINILVGFVAGAIGLLTGF
ncbi:MAG: putative manganese transporter [bacterium]